jgi:hypothetical protein
MNDKKAIEAWAASATPETIEIPSNIRCTFDVSGRNSWSRRNCGAQATALVRPGWGDANVPEGRCKKHASVDARRTYKVNVPVEVTHEAIAKVLALKAEADADAKAARAQKAAEAEKRHAAYVARRAEEAKRRFTVTRKDERGDIDFEASRGKDELVYGPGSPKYYVHDIQLEADRVGGSLGETSVEVERAADLPTTLRLRTAGSSIEIHEARALIVALETAIIEATRDA